MKNLAWIILVRREYIQLASMQLLEPSGVHMYLWCRSILVRVPNLYFGSIQYSWGTWPGHWGLGAGRFAWTQWAVYDLAKERGGRKVRVLKHCCPSWPLVNSSSICGNFFAISWSIYGHFLSFPFPFLWHFLGTLYMTTSWKKVKRLSLSCLLPETYVIKNTRWGEEEILRFWWRSEDPNLGSKHVMKHWRW